MGNAMEPKEILQYCLSNLEDVAQVESWEERGIYYNPGGVLKPLILESYEFAKEKFAKC